MGNESSLRNKTFNEILEVFVDGFIKAYNSPQNSFPVDNMPRRMQLSSIITQLFVQNIDKTKILFEKFFDDSVVRNYFGYSKNDADLGKMMAVSQVCILDNSGGGGSQQPIMVVSNILLTAVDLAVLEYGKINKPNIVANIPKALDYFKTFASGGEVREEYLVGISGFSVDDNVNIGLDGEIKARSLNNVQSAYFFGPENKVELVIQGSFNRKLLFSGTFDEMKVYLNETRPVVNMDFRNKMDKAIWTFRLALILSLSDNKKPFFAFANRDYLISSSGNISHFMWNNGMEKKRTDIKIKQSDAYAITIKYLTILKKDISSIEFAANRLLRAVCLRDDLDDAFVDAIMCWENMIGAEHEVTFKICSSIAKLLSKSQDERNDLYKRLKDIYDTRSKLLHGNNKYETDPDKINSAIIYAIKLMNVMLDNDELLGSKDRSQYILLDN